MRGFIEKSMHLLFNYCESTLFSLPAYDTYMNTKLR